MPIYEYECSHCRRRFEVRQSFSDEAATECPECGVLARRLFHPVGIIFKGSGFYSTDHGKGNRLGSNSDSNGSEPASPAETKEAPETTAEPS